MVYREDTGDYIAISAPPLYVPKRRLHVGAAGKCFSSDSTEPEIFHLEDQRKRFGHSAGCVDGLCYQRGYLLISSF